MEGKGRGAARDSPHTPGDGALGKKPRRTAGRGARKSERVLWEQCQPFGRGGNKTHAAKRLTFRGAGHPGFTGKAGD